MVHSDLGVYRCKYVIVAVPVSITYSPPPQALFCTLLRLLRLMQPVVAGTIQYSPPLPAIRDQLTQRMPMGCVIKVRTAHRSVGCMRPVVF